MFPRAPEICPLFVTHFVEHRGGPHHRDNATHQLTRFPWVIASALMPF